LKQFENIFGMLRINKIIFFPFLFGTCAHYSTIKNALYKSHIFYKYVFFVRLAKMLNSTFPTQNCAKNH
jgi:hypothetical protein